MVFLKKHSILRGNCNLIHAPCMLAKRVEGVVVNRSPYSLGCTAAGLPAGARAVKTCCGELGRITRAESLALYSSYLHSFCATPLLVSSSTWLCHAFLGVGAPDIIQVISKN